MKQIVVRLRCHYAGGETREQRNVYNRLFSLAWQRLQTRPLVQRGDKRYVSTEHKSKRLR
jgi:hypothetical protein